MGGSTVTPSEIGENYMLNRDYRESTRLHVQDWIWRTHLGFHLHPKVDTAVSNKSSIAVADIGCSNATWLLSLALSRPSDKWSFTGIDISASTFPAPENLPANVELRQLNAFEPFPAEMHGRFDVVHLRALALVIKGGSPLPLLRNVMQLLKPGGFVQWEDVDTSTFRAVWPRPTVASTSTAAFLERWQAMSARIGLDVSWVRNLDSIFTEAGLDETASIHLAPWAPMRKAWTDNLLVGYEEHGQTLVRSDPTLLGTPAEYEETLRKVVIEAGNGVCIDVDSYCAIGRKPR